jgi:CheY-like chemotaxis protein
VSGDPDRLQQVFWNLLSNAVKFTPSGGMVDVQVERLDSQVQVTVRDTGMGIRPEFVTHVFERFTQADTSPRRVHGGLGLGLAIVRHLVELHGGTVGAHSGGEGQGSTFFVRLPIAALRPKEPGQTEEHAAAVERRQDVPQSLAGIRVLLVDDEADARVMMETLLSRFGAQVTTASSAPEALRILRESKPDVLLADIGRPREDGYDLIRQVRSLPAEEGRSVPAAALTAYGRPEDRARALAAGYQLHAAKPILPDALIAVDATLARHR